MTVDERTGKRVKITNPKHDHYKKFGNITLLDRGNIWIKLDSGETICTRDKSLTFVK